MTKELWCNDCGIAVGDPIQSNIDRHKAETGHKDIVEKIKLLDDGTLASNPGTLPEETKPEETKAKAVTKKASEDENPDRWMGQKEYNKRNR